MHDLLRLLGPIDLNNLLYDDFDNIALHVPIKKKYARANNVQYMSKELRTAVIHRSRLRNQLYRKKRERKKCISMFRNAKREFYINLNPSLVVDNRSFWKTFKPSFSENQTVMHNISLNDNNESLTENIVVASCFGEYFDNAVKELRIINEFQFLPYDSPDQKTETVTEVIERYKNHPSILKIVEVMDESCTFSFSMVSINEVRHEINKLCVRKSSPIESIPPMIILHNSDIFAYLLHKNFNNSLITGTFPENLKLADVTPAHKKGDRMDETNYRPINILSPISKIFESLLYNQINSFFENKFSKLQCGFR